MSAARYRDEYNMFVISGGVLAMSISTLLNFSFQIAIAFVSTSSNVESPTSLSALAQAWSAETNDTPTRNVIVSGLPAKDRRAPDWYIGPPMRF